MATITEAGTDVTEYALEVEAQLLRHRAESLRQQAATLDEVLGTTYRRRASELEMEAWVLEIRAGAHDDDEVPAAS